jgi:hypothetical protein
MVGRAPRGIRNRLTYTAYLHQPTREGGGAELTHLYHASRSSFPGMPLRPSGAPLRLPIWEAATAKMGRLPDVPAGSMRRSSLARRKSNGTLHGQSLD